MKPRRVKLVRDSKCDSLTLSVVDLLPQSTVAIASSRISMRALSEERTVLE